MHANARTFMVWQKKTVVVQAMYLSNHDAESEENSQANNGTNKQIQS